VCRKIEGEKGGAFDIDPEGRFLIFSADDKIHLK
jgi:hypothetical protein